MEIDTLRTFVAVAQHGGVLAASRALRVPKQTVSRRLAQLEESLGVALFARDRRPLALSDAGRLFVERCLSIVTSADAAVAELQHHDALVTGPLRVASPALFLRLYLAPLLGPLVQQFPLLRVELLATDELDPGAPWELDLVIWFGALPDVQWRATRLGNADNVLCAAPAVAAQLRSIEPADLARVRTVHYSRGIHAPTWRLASGGGTVEIEIEPWLRTNDADAALAVVLGGHGVARLPPVLAEPYIREGRLERILPAWRVELGPITALHRPSSRSAVAMQALLGALRRSLMAAQSPETLKENLT